MACNLHDSNANDEHDLAHEHDQDRPLRPHHPFPRPHSQPKVRKFLNNRRPSWVRMLSG